MRKIYFLILTTFLILLTCSVGFLPDAHFHSAFADTEKCQTCKGSGQVSVSVSCSACSGQGKIGEVQTCVGCNGNGTITRSCDSCGGSGMVETPCSACGGSGMISGGMDAEGNPVEEPCGCGGGMVSESCGVCGGSGSFSETCSGCSGNGLIDERPACEECSGSGSVQSQILCSDCNGTGDALFNVIFTLPDQTKVTKRLKSLTSDVIREVWNTSDLMKNHYELKGFYLYKNGSQIPSSEVTLPYSIVEDGYSVLLAAKTYTVTWNLNLPSGVTDWYLSGSQGENLQTSTQSYESLACMDSQTYSGDSVLPPHSGAVLGVGCSDSSAFDTLTANCAFKGWATDSKGTNLVFPFSGFDLELTSDNKHYYKPTSRLETPYYITADTTFYAVYDYQDPTSTLSFPQVSDCYFRYKIGDGDWVTDYSSYSYKESSLPFTVTTEITKMNVVDKLWRGFKAGTAPMNMPTNFTPVFTYTIDSFEDLTFAPDFEEACKISFSSSSDYDFEFRIEGNGISIEPIDWTSVSSFVGQSFYFTRGNVIFIRNVSIVSADYLFDSFTFNPNPVDSSDLSLYQWFEVSGYSDGSQYALSTNPNVSESLVSTSVALSLKETPSYDVVFTLPDQTKVTKQLKSLTSDVIREVWNTSDLMKNHYELKGFYLYKNGSQIPSSEVTLPYSIVEDGYSVLLAAKTYTVTWNLNLPSGVTDWYLSGSQGENLQTSTQSYESLACMDSQTYSGDSVPPPCAGAILGIGFLDPNMSGALPEGCNFLGWATDPEGTNIVFSFSGFDLELSEGNKPYYKPTSRLETPYYITADTTFYAVYDVKSYSIEYNLNGGTLGENFPSSWTYPEKLNIPDATKAGSVFAGWYYDENFTVKYNNGDAPNSSYVSDNTFRLYAKFTVPGLKFRSRTSTDGELTELTSSTNEFPVSYSGTIWEITGMPEYTFSSDSLVLDCFCLTTTQYKIRFYRLNVVVQSIVKVEELQTYSYPFKLDSSLYSLSTDGIVYADADLYDYVTVSDPLAAVATFNFWEWSYEKIDGTWVGTKRFLGHTTETRLLAVSNYKVSYLLGRVGLNSTRSVFRIDGPVTVTYPLIGGMNIAVSVDITVGLKSKIDIHLYADDESTKAYLNDEKPSYQPVTPNVPSNNGSVLDSIGSSFGAILKPLIIVAVIVFAAWLAVNLFGSRRRR